MRCGWRRGWGGAVEFLDGKWVCGLSRILVDWATHGLSYRLGEHVLRACAALSAI